MSSTTKQSTKNSVRAIKQVSGERVAEERMEPHTATHTISMRGGGLHIDTPEEQNAIPFALPAEIKTKRIQRTKRKSDREASIEPNNIYQEDCLSTLKRMKDDSVDLVVTSPPYNMNLRIRNGKYCSRQIVKEISTKYTEFDDNMPIDEYNKLHSEILKELLRVSELVFYNIQIVTGSKRSVFKMIGDFAEHLKDIIIWDKGHAQPSIQQKVLNRRTELILVFDKDYPISRQYRKRATFPRGTLDDIWEIKRERSQGGEDHGAVFPKELVFKILENFSEQNDIVYDPFMGTGTTAVVSKILGRKYLGSEISEKYVEIANNRLEKTLVKP